MVFNDLPEKHARADIRQNNNLLSKIKSTQSGPVEQHKKIKETHPDIIFAEIYLIVNGARERSRDEEEWEVRIREQIQISSLFGQFFDLKQSNK